MCFSQIPQQKQGSPLTVTGAQGLLGLSFSPQLEVHFLVSLSDKVVSESQVKGTGFPPHLPTFVHFRVCRCSWNIPETTMAEMTQVVLPRPEVRGHSASSAPDQQPQQGSPFFPLSISSSSSSLSFLPFPSSFQKHSHPSLRSQSPA